MSSAFANRFNAVGRPGLWAQHAETLALRVSDGAGGITERTIQGTWKRVLPDVANDEDGIGAQAYRGTAMVVVKVADLPDPPGPEALIVRNGESWSVRHPERQDEWTWVLHLARPDAEIRLPTRLR